MRPALAAAIFANLWATSASADAPQRVEIRVGGDGDLRGSDGRVLQAAADYVARLGGGTVRVAPGRYLMRNSLVLADNVRVVGEPGKTLLVSCDAHQSKLASTGGTNERRVTLKDPSGFRIGDGIMVQDDESMYGFAVTQATLVARLDDRTFQVSRPLGRDYSTGRNARVTSAFPIIAAYGAENVEIEGLILDGNAGAMEYLTGCRGGGIYLFECKKVRIRDCVVKNYNGDGISFQDSHHVRVEDCACEDNRGVGLHPGCGASHATVRGNRCANNEGDGLFLCWRVRHSLFENNQLSHNRRHGVSIGHKDSDNVFRGNTVLSNAQAGVFFRRQPASGGAHRNVFESNRILDNASCVRVEGEHHDLVFRDNELGLTEPPRDPAVAFDISESAKGLKAVENRLVNVRERSE